jgi:hypothetical protein
MPETELDRLRRKRDQAWEMAGLARQDGDMADAQRQTEAARQYTEQIQQLLEVTHVLRP